MEEKETDTHYFNCSPSVRPSVPPSLPLPLLICVYDSSLLKNKNFIFFERAIALAGQKAEATNNKKDNSSSISFCTTRDSSKSDKR